ncbi:uncharacterized protein [Physcomitrium patens]|uniref:V-SNARE coiled-coil homology domain-containing protein n=1 Tax=Physcomitrium patens TaxID=3218 RepID=A0A2K1J4I6_PHYPA|nr:uncharacterized protein LOC112294116 isoform X2 [Physcomitrium patens]XP_024400067.1 uncharacterized protein LOC112294116 isoform X2 [Physcomitrium patens]PNR36420.1 hypothetical protein PHYPA_022271 [Physcomitrium patens]|eukprot:XP_024400066.1 uncharacterized protein LOC112294116 isoform X2 [Physcomitrella patens]
MQDKVNIAATKGGKALMGLIHKAKHSPEEHRTTETPNDTEGDSDELNASSPKTSMERKEKLVNKLKRGLKGKAKNKDAEIRSQLLNEKQNEISPRLRSADSIKLAYGHKPNTDTASIAAMNKDKLIERQEKLQALDKQSEELAEGAGDFASIAEELAKRAENKKWFKL